MRTSIIRAYALGIITGGFLTAGTVFLAGPAKADGYIDDTEADYISVYAGAICTAIDSRHTTAGVLRIGEVIVADGFAPDSAVDIINGSVQTECPRNWPLLVSIGNAARAEVGATA